MTYTARDITAQLLGAAIHSIGSTTEPTHAQSVYEDLRRIAAETEDVAAVAVRLAIAAASAVDVAARALPQDRDVVRRQVLAVADLWAQLPGEDPA